MIAPKNLGAVVAPSLLDALLLPALQHELQAGALPPGHSEERPAVQRVGAGLLPLQLIDDGLELVEADPAVSPGWAQVGEEHRVVERAEAA